MKLNLLAVMAISTLFAASIACAAPATTQLADDTNSMSGTSNIGGNNTDQSTADNANSTSTTTTTDNNTDNNADSTSNSNDDMSADTATGDDDY